MTNEQAKQEAIKKAYGDLWSTVEEFVTDIGNGKSYTSFYKPDKTIFDFRELRKQERENFIFYGQNGYVLPKSIQGIEENNGWIRIEPDGSNLPIDSSNKYKGYNINEKCFYDNSFSIETVRKSFDKAIITHYKIIEKELKPIY